MNGSNRAFNEPPAFALGEDDALSSNVSMSDIVVVPPENAFRFPESRGTAKPITSLSGMSRDGSFLFFPPGNAPAVRGANGSIKYSGFGQSVRERDIRFDLLSAANLRYSSLENGNGLLAFSAHFARVFRRKNAIGRSGCLSSVGRKQARGIF